MKKMLAFSLVVILLAMMCDVPVFSELVSGDYGMYNEYRTSLITLQQDIAQLYLELQEGKNQKASYHHVLQITENAAALIGKAEVASHHVYNGFQGSLQGHLELLCDYGISGEQKQDLMNLGYTGEDIAKIKKSLAYYNDYYYHAAEEFIPEQILWFSSMGLTDEQISELQAAIHDHYTHVHILEEEIKQHQTELLYIQVSLSMAALKILLDQEDKGKDKSELKDAEEKLLEAIATVSEDQSSLEHVKAYSKHVYKAAEQKIRKGENHYMTDFFIGLQVHCGAVTALHGDTEFGLTEIRSYEHILSECIKTERSELLHEQGAPVDEQFLSSDTVSVLDFTGQVEESDEDNNTGYIIVVVKTFGTTLSDFVQMMVEWGIQEVVRNLFEEFLIQCISLAAEAAAFVTTVGGVIFTLIVTAPPVGGSWVECVVDCMTEDPSGIFLQIFEDEDTVATIEAGANNENIDDCERLGYYMVYTDPMQIVYTIMHAIEVYRSPDNHYFYYMTTYSSRWVVEVEVLEHGCCGRVARAYEVTCEPYRCGGHSDLTIREKWVLCDNFTLVWTR